jgi:ankyrin repeat protein
MGHRFPGTVTGKRQDVVQPFNQPPTSICQHLQRRLTTTEEDLRFLSMTPLRLFIFIFIFLVWNVIAETGMSRGDDAASDDHIKAYNNTRNESELYDLIKEKNFTNALKRLKEVPQEAGVLIEVLGGPKGIDVVKTGLPLHFVFDVDLPMNLPQAKRKDRMSQEQVELILALLKENPLATAQKDKFGRIPLHVALMSPVPPPAKVVSDMVKLYPASVRMRGLQGLTPLHMAVSYPMTTLENIKVILGAYPEAAEMMDEGNSLPIHIAAWGGSFPESKAVIELLLKQNPSHLSVPDGDNETILSIMAKYGRTSEEAVRYILLKDYQAVHRVRDEINGNTAVHDAVVASNHQNNTIYKPFVEHHKELLKKSNRLGRLPIHEAMQRCCSATEMVLDLIDGFPLGASMRDGQGYLPLHHACNVGVMDVEIVQALIDKSPASVTVEMTTSKFDSGPLPLHLALSHAETQGQAYLTMNSVIELLLHRYPEAAKIKDPRGDLLPLVQAFLSRRSGSVLQQLMNLSPKDVSTTLHMSEGGEMKSTTLLHVFASQAHGYMKSKEIVEIIGAFVAFDPSLFETKDSDGRLPLHVVWNHHDTISESRQALVDSLLTRNPKAVYVADNENRLPLSHAASARDVKAFELIFRMNPLASAVKSAGGSFPLHFLCGSGLRSALSSSIDAMMSILVDQFPVAAGEADEKGNLPLHFLCKTAGSGHVKSQTLKKLIAAYPEALTAVDENGMLPLQLAVLSAAASYDAKENENWAAFVELLIDANPSAVSKVSTGKIPLPVAIDKIETLSDCRRQENDHMLRIVRHLYKVHPEGIRSVTSKERNCLHSLLVLLGDMGGMAPTGWSEFTIEVIRDFPALAKQRDIHGRTPLHIFCLFLGDTAVGLRENQDPRTRSNVPGIEDTFLALLQAYPDAMEQTDQYVLTPLELASHDRLRYAKGGKRFYNSELLNMMKRHLRRGIDFWKMRNSIDFWKMRNSIDFAKTCSELKQAVESVNEQLQVTFEQLEIEPSNLSIDEYSCSSRNAKLCMDCEGEQELLGAVENALTVYGDAMEEMGKDANEISGAYYPGGYSY